MKKNILVFPCGSEIGLEIYRSLEYSTHFNLFGGSSVEDHGKFVYDQYIENIPFFEDEDFIKSLNNIIDIYDIDAIYPTMDGVINKLARDREKINCKIIASTHETTNICLHKSQTYALLSGKVAIPKIYKSLDDVENYPIFIKPNVGYGSRGANKIEHLKQGIEHLKNYPDSIIVDYLPGAEYTVDCFTDRKGKLRFIGPRQRKRIMNGISVNTIPIEDNQKEFYNLANEINKLIEFRGAWFFQVKRDENNKLNLLEVACRLGGSSSLFRNKGVNFALLTLFDAFELDVDIFTNNYPIVMDRALDNKYKIDIKFSTAYIDFDDCLILDNNKVNTNLIKLLYQFINNDIKLILITKHQHNINKSLAKYRLENIFDEIIHIDKNDDKFKYINTDDAIFIDDSHFERKSIHENCKIHVFSPDNIESLLK